MTEDNFVDYVSLNVRSGNGGRGSSHLRREKFVAKGGPDGGDGGNGGSVIFQSDRNLNTLIDYRYAQHFKAQHGKPGSQRHKTRGNGKDLILKVPLGTQIYEEDTYVYKIRLSYPSIGDQLDMLWHAIDTGDWTAAKVKTTDFYTQLKAVKDANPKP